MRRTRTFLLALAFPLALIAGSTGFVAAGQTAEAKAPESIAEKTKSMEHMPGLLPLDWDAKAGKLYLEVPMDGNASHTRSQDLIWSNSTPWSMGSSQLGGYGMDRGQVAPGVIVHFERTGQKLLLVEPNLDFRSSSSDAAERAAVEESFPISVVAGFKLDAENADGTLLVDATEFFLSDVHHVAEGLAEGKQGAFHVDEARSTIVLEHTKAFPKNTVVEAELTFSTRADDTQPVGRILRQLSPDPRAVTIRERQNFVELPPPGFAPRRFSPRAGYFPMEYRDYDAPLSGSLEEQFILRHRLIKKDPSCTHSCEAVAPIQYYVDRGAPEPLRGALVEGARWWDQAFQAAGWAPGTFRVDVLPEGADPMDVRYNIIQWVHRYTRGWSYGEAIADPRTGEILKGNVTLGSLRGRQDYLIAEALLAPYAHGKAAPDEANDAALQMVLQRVRQLGAHETGHTLGLAHNFAASAFPHPADQTMSVMDYPHPWVTAGANGVPDLSHAYPAGIGTWDKVAIDYGYREFDRDGKPVEDPAALDRILRDSEKTGMTYITDEDARPLGGAHPHAHLWDNGSDPAAELDRVLTVRAAALKRFGVDAIHEGQPLAQLEDTLVPLYLFHRYQTEAAAKEIGGLDYRYNVRGDDQKLPEIVDPEDQRHALASVLKTLSPEMLTLPESLLKMLPPRTPGLPRTDESFPSDTGVTFDPVAAAESAADLTLDLMFNAQRANRLVEYHARDSAEPSLDEVIDATLKSTGGAEDARGLTAEVKRGVDSRIIEAMLGLAADPEASPEVKGTLRVRLQSLHDAYAHDSAGGESAAWRAFEVARIDEFLKDPAKFVPGKAVPAPPGMPIGDEEQN
jgi:hypothetical protein